MSKPSTTPVVRSYLAHVYWLSDQDETNGYIGTQRIADRMLVTLSAVNRMIMHMRQYGLIDHQPYRGVRLTAAGEREAHLFLRPYSIIKTFLVRVMGFGWHQVHDEALQMTLGDLNERIIRRMNALAGYPTHDPHGYPIAKEPGTVAPLQGNPLSDVEEGEHYCISRVVTHAADRLEYLAALQLTPGTPFQVVKVMPFNGPVQVQIEREYRIIGRELTRLLRVVPTPRE